MSLSALVILILYSVALGYITLYCLMQFDLLVRYGQARRKGQASDGLPPLPSFLSRQRQKKLAETSGTYEGAGGAGLVAAGEEGSATYPMVTVQLPVYNEKYVIERLIDHVARLDYPRERLEIQVLDDSTDETRELGRRKVAEYASRGYRIEHIRRERRDGYKAGALRDALHRSSGSFIAIFDADFMPAPDFLLRTIPYFREERVGVVQTRWEHANEDYGLLTRLQAMQLNVHFSVEQAGRMAGGYLLQFNGTAGIWRKSAIEDAGGWQPDTLTEDLDLSIRAQLKGWRIQYLEQVGTPAELPVDMASLKSQQFRWMKGGAETARKLLPAIWRSRLGWLTKWQATFHLLASTIFVFILLAAISSVPLTFQLDSLDRAGIQRDYFAWFLIGLLSIMAVYFTGNVLAGFHRKSRRTLAWQFLWRFPLFLSLSMGMALHNSWAVLQGYFGKPSPFVRTPKFAIRGAERKKEGKSYALRAIPGITLLEGLLAGLFLLALLGAIMWGHYTFFGFHLLLAFGFGAIFTYSLRT